MLNHDKEKAEDALQNLFLKLAEKPEQFDTTKKFKTWIYTVATNVCKNYYRHQTVINKAHAELSYLSDINEKTALNIIDIDKNQFKSELEKVLHELPFDKRETFVLRYINEKTISEIAKIQNCAEGTIKSRIHYTLKILQEQLKEYKS